MSEKPVMTQRQGELFAFFKTAIDAERSAQEMYREAMALCDDQELRTLVEGFYGEEVKHEQFLLEEYARRRDEFGEDAL